MFVRIDPSSRAAGVSRRHRQPARDRRCSARSSTSYGRGEFGASAERRSPPTRAMFPSYPREVYVDCTAAGVPAAASATGVRAGPHHDPVRGRGLPALVRRHDRIRRVDRPRRRGEEPALPARRLLRRRSRSGAAGLRRDARARSLASRHEEVGPWNAASRLNPARAALDHIDDADVAESLAFMIEHTQEALKNLERTATMPPGQR